MEQTKRLTPEKRREALLEAAREVFLAHGFVGTRLDMITNKAGGSRRSIYNEFGGKDGIFVAIVEDTVKKMYVALTSIKAAPTATIREKLTTLAFSYLKVLLNPETLGLFRLVQMEYLRFPKVAQYFFEAGPDMAVYQVLEIIEQSSIDSKIKDSRQAAEQFMAMLRGNFHFKILLGLREAPNDDELNDFIDSSVDIFLFGVMGNPAGRCALGVH